MNHTEIHMKEGLVGGASVEAISGIGAVVLAIIGLANIFPGPMLAVAGMAAVVLGILALIGALRY